MSRALTVSTLVCLTNLSLFSAQLWYTKPATQWREAIPVGNGRLAAMVFGGIDAEHLQLNEETIYAGKAMNRTNPDARAHIRAVRELLLSGKVAEAEAMADKTLLAIPRRQPPYEPLGDLRVEFRSSAATETTSYKRSLDLNNGTLTVEYQRSEVHYKRQAFASYPDQVIVLHLESDGPGGLDFTAGLDRVQDARSSLEPSLGENTVALSGMALPPSNDKKYADERRNDPCGRQADKSGRRQTVDTAGLRIHRLPFENAGGRMQGATRCGS
jgi:alpha-L-fucosidase 2